MAGSKKKLPIFDEQGREWFTAAEAERRWGKAGATYRDAEKHGLIESKLIGKTTFLRSSSVRAHAKRLDPDAVERRDHLPHDFPRDGDNSSPAPSAATDATSTDGLHGVLPDLNRSKAIGEWHKARMAKIKADEAEGLLIPIEQLEFAYEKAGIILQQKMRALGPMLSPHMTEAGQKIFKNSVDDILTEVVRALEEAADEQDDESEAE